MVCRFPAHWGPPSGPGRPLHGSNLGLTKTDRGGVIDPFFFAASQSKVRCGGQRTSKSFEVLRLGRQGARLWCFLTGCWQFLPTRVSTRLCAEILRRAASMSIAITAAWCLELSRVGRHPYGPKIYGPRTGLATTSWTVSMDTLHTLTGLILVGHSHRSEEEPVSVANRRHRREMFRGLIYLDAALGLYAY
jgi:hypothetical protein